MKAHDIWQRSLSTLTGWGLREIPFRESSVTARSLRDRHVFIGRERELERVFTQFHSRERKNILVYGPYGIGKTAFLIEVLRVIRRYAEGTLTAYLSLPQGMDLETAAIVALAREMPEDDFARNLLVQNNAFPEASTQKRKRRIKLSAKVIEGELEKEDVPANKSGFAALNFEDLLDRALQRFSQVVLAIDDIEKQDPARARQLLQNAQGLLKMGASFMVTGHPEGLAKEVMITNMGLFDQVLELSPFDQSTSYRLLVEYLDSARLERPTDRGIIDLSDGEAVRPFLPETALQLCNKAEGIPRWINRSARYVMTRALELRADTITEDVLLQGMAYLEQRLRNQDLSIEERGLLDLVIKKGRLSDEEVTSTELQLIGAKEFSELLPRLERLVMLDLLRRQPSVDLTEYAPTPMLLRPKR